MTTYADRPWTKSYDPGVPKTLEPYPDITVQSFLQEAVQKHPTSVALISSAHVPVLGRQASTITYAELDKLSDTLASGLVDMGLKKGDRVAIIMPNIAAFVISYYAILKAGGVVAAANPTYPPDKMQFQINDCDAEIVLTMSLFYNAFKTNSAADESQDGHCDQCQGILAPGCQVSFYSGERKERRTPS